MLGYTDKDNKYLPPYNWWADDAAKHIVEVVNNYYRNTGFSFYIQQVCLCCTLLQTGPYDGPNIECVTRGSLSCLFNRWHLMMAVVLLPLNTQTHIVTHTGDGFAMHQQAIPT